MDIIHGSRRRRLPGLQHPQSPLEGVRDPVSGLPVGLLDQESGVLLDQQPLQFGDPRGRGRWNVTGCGGASPGDTAD